MPDNDNWWNPTGAQPEDTPAHTDQTQLAGHAPDAAAPVPPAEPTGFPPDAMPPADPTAHYAPGSQVQSPYGAPQYGQTGVPQYGQTGAQPYAQPGYPAGHPAAATPGGQYPQVSNPYGYPQYGPPTGAQPYPQQPGYHPATGSYPPMQPGVPYGYPQGGGPGYPGTPFPDSLAARPPRRRTGPIVAIVAIVVLLVGGGITAAVVAARHHSTTTADSTSESAPTSTAGLPGYQPVTVPGTGIKYQVPADWTASPWDSVTLDGTGASATGTGKSFAGADYCPGSAYRSEVLVVPSTTADPAAAATATAAIAAQAPAGYSDRSGGRLTPPTAFTSTAGISGQRAQADGSWTPGAPGCTTTTYTVYTFAFRAPDGTGTLVLCILSDRGTTDELSADQATKILATVQKA